MNRQNVQRIDHVVFLVWLENLEEAVSTFSRLLDVPFEGPFECQGVRIYVNFDAGVEIYAPFDSAVAKGQSRFLEEKGEGIYRVVFGVADREVAIERASSMGFDAVRIDGFDVNPAWRERFGRMDEAPLTRSVHGTRINFGQIEPLED